MAPRSTKRLRKTDDSLVGSRTGGGMDGGSGGAGEGDGVARSRRRRIGRGKVGAPVVGGDRRRLPTTYAPRLTIRLPAPVAPTTCPAKAEAGGGALLDAGDPIGPARRMGFRGSVQVRTVDRCWD